MHRIRRSDFSRKLEIQFAIGFCIEASGPERIDFVREPALRAAVGFVQKPPERREAAIGLRIAAK